MSTSTLPEPSTATHVQQQPRKVNWRPNTVNDLEGHVESYAILCHREPDFEKIRAFLRRLVCCAALPQSDGFVLTGQWVGNALYTAIRRYTSAISLIPQTVDIDFADSGLGADDVHEVRVEFDGRTIVATPKRKEVALGRLIVTFALSIER